MQSKIGKADQIPRVIFCVVCFGTLVRLCVTLHPYSGS